MIERILVATDFSDPATNAVRYASALAKRLGAKLTLVYADPFFPPIDYLSGGAVWSDVPEPNLEQKARQQLADTARMQVDRAVTTTCEVFRATPVEGILERLRKGDVNLVVMGTHGRTGIARVVLGSVAESVMRRSPVPVLAIPPDAVPIAGMKTILCAIESDARGAELLRFVAALAPKSSEFIVVGTVPDHGSDDDVVSTIRQSIPRELKRRSSAMAVALRDAAAKISQLALGVNADLIVAAEPASRHLAELVSGSFAEKLLRYHTCPVLSFSENAAAHAELTPMEMALD